MTSSRGKQVETYVVKDSDILPVSKFSKYDAHAITSNEELIVYTSSKLAVVRVICQKSSKHYSFDTDVKGKITDLSLAPSTDPEFSLLIVGSRQSGIFTFWILRHDDKDIPALLSQKLVEVPKSIKYSAFNIDKIYVALSWNNNIDILTVTNSNTAALSLEENDNGRIKSSTKYAELQSLNTLERCRFQFEHDIAQFAFSPSLETLLVLFTPKFGTVIDSRPYLDRIKFPLLRLVRLPPQLIHVDKEKYPSLNGIIHTPERSTIQFFSAPGSTQEFFLVCSESNSQFSLYSNSEFPHLAMSMSTRVSFFDDSFSLVSFEKSLSAALIVSQDKSKTCIISFDTSSPDKNQMIPFKLVWVKLPSSLHVLDCKILKSIEPEKYANKDVADIYIYHSRGIAIVPVVLPQRPASKPKKSEYASIPNTDKRITDCITGFVEENSYTDDHSRFLIEFFTKSDFLNIVTDIVVQRVQSHITVLPEGQEKSKTLSFETVSTGDFSDQQSQETKEEAESDSDHQEGHMLPALIDSLEEASRSEPYLFTSPRQNAVDYDAPLQMPQMSNVSNRSHLREFGNPSFGDFSQPSFAAFSPSYPATGSFAGVSPSLEGIQVPPPQQQVSANPQRPFPDTTSSIFHDFSSSNNSHGFSSSSAAGPVASPAPLPPHPATSSIAGAVSRMSLGTTLGQSGGQASSQIWGASSSFISPLTQNSYRQGAPIQQQQSQPQDTFRSLVPPVGKPAATGSLPNLPLQQQLPYPECEVGTSFPEVPGATLEEAEAKGQSAQASSARYLTIEPPKSGEISERERGIVRLLIQKDPMTAFYSIRSSNSSDAASSSAAGVDLGKLLSCAIYISTAASSENGDNGEEDFGFMVSNGIWSEDVALTLPELMNWSRRVFGPHFFLMLGYVAYLLSPALNSGGATKPTDASQVVVRAKWAVALLSVVDHLVSLKNINSGVLEDEDGEDEEIADARAQWAESREIVAPTLTQIRNDALTMLGRNTDPASPLAPIITNLLEIVKNLKE